MSEIDNILKEEAPVVPEVKVETPVPVASNLEQQVKDLQFDVAFKDLTATSPAIKEFRDQIKEKVALGLSVTDASVLVLHQNNKLQVDKTESLGGAAPIVSLSTKEPSTAEEWGQRFQELEARGEINIS